MRTKPYGESDAMNCKHFHHGFHVGVRRKFEKRDWMDSPPPRNLVHPPQNVDCPLAHTIIDMFNEATDAIPCW